LRALSKRLAGLQALKHRHFGHGYRDAEKKKVENKMSIAVINFLQKG